MELDTGYPADSVELCPIEGYRDILACGTYKLLENQDQSPENIQSLSSGPPVSQQRIGKCILLQTRGNASEQSMNILQEIEMSAILDMKWSSVAPVLAIAESEGRVSIYRLSAEERLCKEEVVQCRSVNTLCLSLDWSGRHPFLSSPTQINSIAVSSSDGYLSILRPRDDGTLTAALSWCAHDYEAWITAWNWWDTNTLYSGGDDLRLKAWDIRAGASPAFVNRRFDGGVTSIQSHPNIEHIVAVGSYDAGVRIFDMRKPLIPLTQVEVGGGAWRVKWHPKISRASDLLVACMHDGFKVVRFSSSIVSASSDALQTDISDAEYKIAKHYDRHSSLAYGADWSHEDLSDEGLSLIASCSFYDHVLHAWQG